MKTLSIKQPYASLIAAGVKDILNKNWKPDKLPCRVLIHADMMDESILSNEAPLEWIQEYQNHQTYGNIPNDYDLPVSAIIGYATIERVDKDPGKSIWADCVSQDEGLCYWHLADSFIFDEPIQHVEGENGLWEFGIDEDNLPPSHKVELAEIEIKGENILLPVSEDIWNDLIPYGEQRLERTKSNPSLALLWLKLLLKKGGEIKLDLKTLSFIFKGKKRTFVFSPDSFASYIYANEDKSLMMIFNSAKDEDGCTREYVSLFWDEEIKLLVSDKNLKWTKNTFEVRILCGLLCFFEKASPLEKRQL